MIDNSMGVRRFMWHYKNLIDAVETDNFYTVVHEARECVVWRGRLEREVEKL
jgi:hypothetical protein